MAIVNDKRFDSKLLEALGINQKAVTNLEIRCKAGDVTMVHLEFILFEEQGDKVLKMIRDYYLVEKPDGTN
jgi:hypothetical protein